MRQDIIHPQEEVVTEERDTHLNSQEVSWVSIYAVTPPLWRKQRGSKDPLDDCESGEWKILFKTQCSKTWDHGIQSHHFVASRWGNNGNSDKLDFLRLQNHCRWWLQPWNEKMFVPWKRSYDKSRQHIKKQRHYFANKGPSSQSYAFFQNVRVGLQKKLRAKELMLLNCDVGEDSWASLGQQGDPTSPS